MRNFFIFCVLVLASCTKTVYVPVETVRTVVKGERDNIVRIRPPHETQTVPTVDTVAVAETSLARAKAKVSKGLLTLDIRNKRDSLPVQSKVISVYKTDSVAYPVEVPVEVDVRSVTWYDKVIRWICVGVIGMSLFGITIFDIRKLWVK
mgnify:FL=1